MNWLQRIALALVIIGAINWGLIGFLNFDLVATVFGGQQSLLSRIIYSLVGLSGLYSLTIFFTGMEINDQKDNIRTDMPSYKTEISSELDVNRKDNFSNKEGK